MSAKVDYTLTIKMEFAELMKISLSSKSYCSLYLLPDHPSNIYHGSPVLCQLLDIGASKGLILNLYLFTLPYLLMLQNLYLQPRVLL